MKSRVLVADSPDAIETIRPVLGTDYELIPAESLAGAERCLGSAVDLIVCGIHFDGSRMFELLMAVSSRHSHISFFAFRDLQSSLDPTFVTSVQIAARSLGALGFIDLYSLRQQLGVEKADAHFRRLIASALDRI